MSGSVVPFRRLQSGEGTYLMQGKDIIACIYDPATTQSSALPLFENAHELLDTCERIASRIRAYRDGVELMPAFDELMQMLAQLEQVTAKAKGE